MTEKCFKIWKYRVGNSVQNMKIRKIWKTRRNNGFKFWVLRTSAHLFRHGLSWLDLGTTRDKGPGDQQPNLRAFTGRLGCVCRD